MRTSSEPALPVQFMVDPPKGSRFASNARAGGSAISPDGRTLAFVATNLSFVREKLDALVAHREKGRGGLAAVGEADAPLGEMLSALREAEEGAERVACIVRDLKAFASERGEQRGAVDVLAVLEQAHRLVAHEFRGRARLAFDVPRGPLLVDGRASSLGQVFIHLLLNAARAIPEGNPAANEVRVAVRSEPGTVRGKRCRPQTSPHSPMTLTSTRFRRPPSNSP